MGCDLINDLGNSICEYPEDLFYSGDITFIFTNHFHCEDGEDEIAEGRREMIYSKVNTNIIFLDKTQKRFGINKRSRHPIMGDEKPKYVTFRDTIMVILENKSKKTLILWKQSEKLITVKSFRDCLRLSGIRTC